jgi:hypothetical protein
VPSYSYAYAFSQQTNADCHLQMWANFQQLQRLRTRCQERKLTLQDSDFISHREWLGKGFSNFVNWFSVKNYRPAVKKYLQDAITESPIYPNFFDAKGRNYFTSSYSLTENAQRRSFSAYFLKQGAQSDVSYILPLFKENGRYACFNRETSSYEPVILTKAFPNTLRPKDFALKPGQSTALPANFSSLQLIEGRGKRAFIKALDPDYRIKNRFTPQEIGTYKLLLLNLGLDSNNEPLDSNHEDVAVAMELQTWMQEKGTPWDPTICQKQHLIEFALVTLFKENGELFSKVKKHVDFYFKAWTRYEAELPFLFDQNGTSLKNKALTRYLPGPEQMLAFCLMKNVQYLWVNAISSNAFCHHMGLPSFARYIPYMVGPSSYRRAAYQQNEGASFINVWKEVIVALKTKYQNKQDWVSFSGHGMVISFDSDLLEKQNQQPINDVTLAQDLGIAVIDSLHGKEMNVFYKRKISNRQKLG